MWKAVIAHVVLWHLAGYGAALQPHPLRLPASRGKTTGARASVPLPRRLHPVPFAAIPSKKGKGTLEKIALIGNFAFL